LHAEQVYLFIAPMPAGFAHPLAASCDDGSVRVFHVEGGEPGVHYSRTLTRLQVQTSHACLLPVLKKAKKGLPHTMSN
jgi:hypothetical protein